MADRLLGRNIESWQWSDCKVGLELFSKLRGTSRLDAIRALIIQFKVRQGGKTACQQGARITRPRFVHGLTRKSLIAGLGIWPWLISPTRELAPLSLPLLQLVINDS